MQHPIAPFAREAFAAGWASSGGPLTDRVRVASKAAVQTAIDRAGQPDVLEVTLHLGRLEGMWALLFDRRERLIQKHTTAVTAAWRPLISQRVLSDGIRRFRDDLGLTEQQDQQDQQRDRRLAAAAAAAILAALPMSSGWTDVVAKLRDAIAAGSAEGTVAAVAIAAEEAHQAGLDWDAGFAAAYRDLERLGEVWTQADAWGRRMLQRAEWDLGRVLAQQAEAGASADSMAAAAEDSLTQDPVDAVSFTVDWAVTSAAAAAALALFQRYGALTTWVTAGDGRVCATCQGNEDNSPYAPEDVPACPAHPRCRCQLSASFDLGAFAAWFTT